MTNDYDISVLLAKQIREEKAQLDARNIFFSDILERLNKHDKKVQIISKRKSKKS